MTNHLHQWRQRFDQLNRCQWPGPRPLQDSSEHVDRQLRGRERDVSDLATICISNDLVVVHGESGVGKSSILNVGLIPHLQSLGKQVIVCRDWGVTKGDIPSEFVTAAWREAEGVLEDPFKEVADLDRAFPNQLIVILDQFEELIRNEPAFAHGVLNWVAELAGKTSARFVISLRSEFEYQLRSLHTHPFTKRARFEVAQIDDYDVIEHIIGGDPADPEDHLPIDDTAKAALLADWKAVQEDPDSNAWNRPGLLHLQATMYVLWMNREARSGGPRDAGVISKEDVDKLRSLAEKTFASRITRVGADRSIFGFGLEQSVESSISNCIDACKPRDQLASDEPDEQWVGINRVVRDQTRWIFRDITEHLASGGYKTQQDLWDLAHKVLSYIDEERLRTTPEWASELYGFGDWLGASAGGFGLFGKRGLADGLSDFSSGPAATLSTEELLFELYRAYFFAIEWLHQSNIVQVLRYGESWRVALTHDRFSEGLSSWRGERRLGLDEAVGRYVAFRGKVDLGWGTSIPEVEAGFNADLNWDAAERSATTGSSESGRSVRVIANVRWRQCTIRSTSFSDVLFVNCDFEGSSFEDCTFDGATYVNCVLDDVDFVRCTIRGTPGWRYGKQDWLELDRSMRNPLVEDPPEFRLAVGVEIARDLVALGASTETTPVFIGQSRGLYAIESPTAGQPARALGGEAPVAKPGQPMPEVPDRLGGLVMCGGRLSSLTLRECAFVDSDAVVELRHVAGTSLEICEQTHGRFEVFAAAIRGFTVTLPVSLRRDSSDDPARDESRFDFEFRHAKLINTWFGVGLKGAAEFVDCQVWQLINASTQGEFQTAFGAFEGSPYFGLINTGRAEPDRAYLDLSSYRSDDKPLFTQIETNDAALAELREVSKNIDFRS